MTNSEIMEAMKTGRVDLAGGWYLVRDDKPEGKYFGEWFLSNPDDVWVARFWDGPYAGSEDAFEFVAAIYKDWS